MLDRCVPLIMIDLQQGATAYRSQQAKLALITCRGGPFCLRLPVRCSLRRGPLICGRQASRPKRLCSLLLQKFIWCNQRFTAA